MAGAMLRKFGQAAAVSPGFAAWPSLIGDEMLLDPNCATGVGWDLGLGYTIAVGKMTVTTANAATVNTGTPASAFLPDAVYRCAITADSVTLNGFALHVNDTTGVTRTAAGTYTEDLINAGESDGWFIQNEGGNLTAQLDNFSVKSVGLMGVEADWTFTGGIFWSVSDAGLVFDSAPAGETAELTGSAKTAFDAAVSSATACMMSVYVSSYGEGNLEARLKGGSWIALDVSADGWSTPVAITSGAGSGCEFRSLTGTTALTLRGVDIDLA